MKGKTVKTKEENSHFTILFKPALIVFIGRNSPSVMFHGTSLKGI